MIKNLILKYRTYLILFVVAILILICAQFLTKKSSLPATQTPSPSQSTQQEGNIQQIISPTPTPLVFSPPPYSQPPPNSQSALETAIANKTKLADKLPIYINNFQTSNGMKTTLNIYTIPSDPSYLIHIEIYGIDFENQDTSEQNNPNTIAFIESFQELKRQLTNRGVDIHNIYFIFGQRTYIQATADLWIKTFKLL